MMRMYDDRRLPCSFLPSSVVIFMLLLLLLLGSSTPPITWAFAAPPIIKGTAGSTNSALSSSPIPPPPPISMPVWSLACPTAAIHTAAAAADDDDDDTEDTQLFSTSMNIMTFCTPVSISPKLWALALYHDTQTKDSFLHHGRGILQLLTRQPSHHHHHQDLISILGKQSGYQVNKEEACRKVGVGWKEATPSPSSMSATTDADDGTTTTNLAQRQQQRRRRRRHHVLPHCATYLEMTVQSTVDAGDHIVAICQVTNTGRWNDDTDALEWLSGDDDDDDDDDEGPPPPPPPQQEPLDAPEVLYTGWLRKQGIL